MRRRKALLGRLVPGPGVIRVLEHAEGDGAPLLAFCREHGLTGVIAKRKDALTDWDAKKARTKLLNIVLMPLLFIGFGLVRWQVRKKKRANIAL